jgi:hypothetical protein
MRIVAYAYQADVHCPKCTRDAVAAGVLKPDPSHCHASPGVTDSNGLGQDLVDREGNILHPLYSFEIEGREVCGTCLTCLTSE